MAKIYVRPLDQLQDLRDKDILTAHERAIVANWQKHFKDQVHMNRYHFRADIKSRQLKITIIVILLANAIIALCQYHAVLHDTWSYETRYYGSYQTMATPEPQIELSVPVDSIQAADLDGNGLLSSTEFALFASGRHKLASTSELAVTNNVPETVVGKEELHSYNMTRWPKFLPSNTQSSRQASVESTLPGAESFSRLIM